MDRLRSALAWSGRDVTLSMFVVSPHDGAPPLDVGDWPPPDRIRMYELEDEAGRLRGRKVYEYDLVWTDFPADLERVVTDCLTAALRHEAIVAWFAFEGSFDFEHLLDPDISGQIYAVAAGEAVRLALEDQYRMSEHWRRLLSELRGHALR